MKITVHTLIKNEQRWIWYALQSVLDHVDEILVWDTGSTDKTIEVVESIRTQKIKLRQLAVKTPEEHTSARQKMIEATNSDWILILDGDEIWWQESLRETINIIKAKPELAAVISTFTNCLGDIFHYQDSQKSHYKIGHLVGPYTFRFINRKIPGLHISRPHGGQEYRDKNELPLQRFSFDRFTFVDKPYLHTTHLPRSLSRQEDESTLKRGFKYRRELGSSFPTDFVYPEVLYFPRPELVPDPFFRRDPMFVAQGLVLEPARVVKRFLFPEHKSGY